MSGIVMSFDAQLLTQKPGSFTSEDGRNKGSKYEWTDLEFNNAEVGSFVLKTVGSILVDAKLLRQELHWELQMEPRHSNGKLIWKVLNVTGGKAKV